MNAPFTPHLSRSDISRRARIVIGRELLFNFTRITDDSEFARDLGANAQDMVDVRHALEGEFGVRFTDQEVAFAKTVGTAIDLIETKLENRGLA
jgi:acyl carrier protein